MIERQEKTQVAREAEEEEEDGGGPVVTATRHGR